MLKLVIKIGCGALLLTAFIFAASRTFARPVKTEMSASIPKYVDDLPIPARIVVPSTPGKTAELEITLTQAHVKMHSSLPPMAAFAYNGSVPGPTIEVEAGQALRVHWKNQLPAKHIFNQAKGAMESGLPDVKSVTHLHGAVVSQPSVTDKLHNNDGWPDLFTLTGEEQIAEYPNVQSSRLLWYHDHAMGDTGRNVAAGLAGLYIIRDSFERSLGLPDGEFEIPLMLQSQGFLGGSGRYYTDDLAAEFYGNAATLNGQLWPRLKVEPRKYRFRIVNASNARTFALRLQDFNNEHIMGPAIYQIGTDAGFLQDAVVFNDPSLADPPRLTLAPAERADVIVDFSNYAGKTLLLGNNSLDIGDAVEIPLPNLMQIQVAEHVSSPDTSKLPLHLKPIHRMAETEASNTRQIVIDSMQMPDGRPMLKLNGLTWHDPVNETPVVDSTEIWEIVNLQPDTHPFHIHLVQFQVLNRVPFDLALYRSSGQFKITGPPVPPEPNEMGWKDVVRATPNYITRIIMKFEPYTGHYVYHCHILEHEDMDMMRPFDVVPKSP